MLTAEQSGRARRAAAEAGRALLDVLFPPACPACEAPVDRAHALCAACWSKARFIDGPACGTCGTPFEFHTPDALRCGACLAAPPPFTLARSALVYDDISKALVLGFKHADRLDLAPALVRWMARAGAPVLAGADLIAPIPLHWRRLLMRRYNQAAEIARGVARQTGLPYAPELLDRTRETPSQGAMPSARARRRNMRGAFRVPDAAQAKGRTVVVVDDVYTTGATLSTAAKALLRAGAAEVRCLTLARVV